MTQSYDEGGPCVHALKLRRPCVCAMLFATVWAGLLRRQFVSMRCGY